MADGYFANCLLCKGKGSFPDRNASVTWIKTSCANCDGTGIRYLWTDPTGNPRSRPATDEEALKHKTSRMSALIGTRKRIRPTRNLNTD